ncbi:MAG: hypothetical protein JSV88_11410 [Candidatus Aminicenantes bacterium]|nr:MAG: hypothetical protein JSV88_11410 [Candidatus Aminicenantes bacterium]
MRKNKSSISKASSYQEIGEFWSEHDLTDFWDQTKPVEFEVNIQSEKIYYSLERDLANEVSKIAQKRGVAAETLLNLWIKEKVIEQKA